MTRPNSTDVYARSPVSKRLAPLALIAAVLLLWQIMSALQVYPVFIIPPPAAVLQKFVAVSLDGSLLHHSLVTLKAVLAGLAGGAVAGAALGYLVERSALLEDALTPFVVALQSTPIVAWAPLLVIWFGSGLTSKAITSALIVFFPTFVNTVVGMRNVPASLQDLLRVHRATRWQVLTVLEIPAALPMLLGGLKISATLAVIGAVVGEFVSADAGLGFLITLARSRYDTPLVLVAVIALAVIARILYGIVSMLERRLLAWQHSGTRASYLQKGTFQE
ncbi:MAG: ABC transporter permease [Anaerolineaceae bacterium]|nr:ABC transporter permease [Anaerolineaceae bacterium]MDE0330081.1 ABC transporter permease [Anaerolineaceae bacterium]